MRHYYNTFSEDLEEWFNFESHFYFLELGIYENNVYLLISDIDDYRMSYELSTEEIDNVIEALQHLKSKVKPLTVD